MCMCYFDFYQLVFYYFVVVVVFFFELKLSLRLVEYNFGHLATNELNLIHVFVYMIISKHKLPLRK